MQIIDLAFNLRGTSLPVDHGYQLFAAVSQILPALHGNPDIPNFAIHPIYGTAVGEGNMKLGEHSRLTVRIPSEDIGRYLPLCGKALTVGDQSLSIGVPEVRTLQPSSTLTSRLVTIKHHEEAGSFLAAVVKELARLEINGIPALVARTAPGSVEGRSPADGKPPRDPFIRRTLRIRAKTIVGFALTISELSTKDSLKLQATGLGGRRHFGCGVFVAGK